jgi:hypothetical protein
VFGTFCVSGFCCVRKLNRSQRNCAQEPAPDVLHSQQRLLALKFSGSYDRHPLPCPVSLTEIDSSRIASGNSSKHNAHTLKCLRSTRILTCVGWAPEIRLMSIDSAHRSKKKTGQARPQRVALSRNRPDSHGERSTASGGPQSCKF